MSIQEAMLFENRTKRGTHDKSKLKTPPSGVIVD